jgi:hypothetical protein
VAVATINGKAYYAITNLLRRVDIPYINLNPGEKVKTGIKLVVTTKKERKWIGFAKTVCVEELDNDPNLAKERIIREVYDNQKDILLIGVDPGLRTGIAAYYRQQEVGGEVANSVKEAVTKIIKLIECSHAKKKIVKIGSGKPDLAEALARSIYAGMRGSVDVELVDERGTSSPSRMKPNRRILRDQHSARLIALRQGKKFVN